MLLADEWSRFAHQRKTLRVSTPRGKQRSAYFLQLPFRYSLPLFLAFAILQYLLSQSLFYARIKVIDIYGVQRDQRAVTTVGYSPLAITVSIALGVALLCVIIVIGGRRYQVGMPFTRSFVWLFLRLATLPDHWKPCIQPSTIIWAVIAKSEVPIHTYKGKCDRVPHVVLQSRTSHRNHCSGELSGQMVRRVIAAFRVPRLLHR